MKTFILVIALLFGVSTAFAVETGSTLNPATAKGEASVLVVHPFLVQNVQGGDTDDDWSNTYLPDVIKGQSLDLPSDKGMYIFSIQKDYSCRAIINVGGEMEKEGVKLTGNWWWTNSQPGTTIGGTQTLMTANWIWPAEVYDADPDKDAWDHEMTLNTYYAYLKVSNINATNAVCDDGEQLKFHITVTGYYTNI